MSLFRGYERAEGWTPRSPEVLVAESTADLLGMPVVDYDSLHKFFTDVVGIPHDQKVATKLYGRRGDEDRKLLFGGSHVPHAKTLRVNAVIAERNPTTSRTGGTMRWVAHEAKHMANNRHRHGMNTTNLVTAAKLATVSGEIYAAHQLPGNYTLLGSLGVLASVVPIRRLADRVIEAPSREEEIKPTTLEHQTDILFPNAYRIYNLSMEGALSVQAIRDLGWGREFENRGHDYAKPVPSGQDYGLI